MSYPDNLARLGKYAPPVAQRAGGWLAKLRCGRVVLYSVLQVSSRYRASSTEANQCCDSTSRRSVPLEASQCALSPGVPGRPNANVTAFPNAQWSRATDVNSVPWSAWMIGANAPARWRSGTARCRHRAGEVTLGFEGQAFARLHVDHRQHAHLFARQQHVVHEVH